MLDYLSIFAGEAVFIFLILLNIRAISKNMMAATLITEFLGAAAGFYLIGQIADTHTWDRQLAYALGATFGSWLGMCMSKHWKEA